MDNFINQLDSKFEEMKREVNKALRDEFNGKIKTSFLIEMKERIKNEYSWTAKYFDTFPSLENIYPSYY